MTEEIKKTITQFINNIPVVCENINFSVDEKTGSIWCALSTKDSSLLIGYRGETLSALNTIARKIIEKQHGEDTPTLMIDINDYHKKKVENIKTTAHVMAERARFFKNNISLDPMNSFERRVVHEFISGTKDLKTRSEGFGPTRHIVIEYITSPAVDDGLSGI